MKRVVFILLLALLPLQASWGVVSAYVVQSHEACTNLSCPQTQEFQEQHAPNGDKEHTSAAGHHHEDRFCGLHALSIIDSFPSLNIFFSAGVDPQIYESHFVPQLLVERPERPKWVAFA